ncbi:MAG TPA: MarR family winged helix-turn-helix transcriptional regulator [Acidimicrobiales bacterium]|nr:MarR family winged helix-turn-helix transcriptional regulator [Acidimicrobiales bacterium]
MHPFRDLSPEQLRRHREHVLLRLLIRTSQAETREVIARLAARGHTSVQASYIGLLANVDTEGTRLVTVAGRVGGTRQAVGQLVKVIEGAGYLERAPDPDDGRGVLVRHTAAGRALLADALAAMADIEAGYEAVIGAARMRALKRSLAEIADAFDPRSRLSDR